LICKIKWNNKKKRRKPKTRKAIFPKAWNCVIKMKYILVINLRILFHNFLDFKCNFSIWERERMKGYKCMILFILRNLFTQLHRLMVRCLQAEAPGQQEVDISLYRKTWVTMDPMVQIPVERHKKKWHVPAQVVRQEKWDTFFSSFTWFLFFSALQWIVWCSTTLSGTNLLSWEHKSKY
jgi:hypothetical protein